MRKISQSEITILNREIDEQPLEMAYIARVRQDVRVTARWTTERKLESSEHFRLACLAMATLGQPDEINPHFNSRQERVTVGPYLSHAVTYVLHDVEHTETDRQLVLQHAMLINVARRMS